MCTKCTFLRIHFSPIQNFQKSNNFKHQQFFFKENAINSHRLWTLSQWGKCRQIKRKPIIVSSRRENVTQNNQIFAHLGPTQPSTSSRGGFASNAKVPVRNSTTKMQNKVTVTDLRGPPPTRNSTFHFFLKKKKKRNQSHTLNCKTTFRLSAKVNRFKVVIGRSGRGRDDLFL